MTTTTRRNRPTYITDSPEHRSIPLERVEMRAAEDDNEIVLEGYASTFEEYEMYGGPAQYGWIERMDPKAFDITLREKPDLHLLINHAGMPLARTKSGNLDLKADDTGLKVTARLDTRDPEVQSLAVKMERGDMDEMSFAFRVKAQEWRAADGFEDDNQSYRTITEVSLHKGDVSVVNWGANSGTSAGIRSANDAVKFLADADESEFAEIRDDQDTLKRAIDKLSAGFKTPVVNIENFNVEGRKVVAIDEATGVITLEPEARDEEEADENEAVTPTVEMLAARIVELEALITGTATEEVEELSDDETTDEVTEEVPEAPSTRFDEALAEQGILPEKLSLAAALAFAD